MIEAIVERYVQARDRKAQLKAAYEAQTAALDDAMKKCEAFILRHFNETGQTSAGTAAGTAYVSTVTSATVAPDTIRNGGNSQNSTAAAAATRAAVERPRMTKVASAFMAMARNDGLGDPRRSQCRSQYGSNARNRARLIATDNCR